MSLLVLLIVYLLPAVLSFVVWFKVLKDYQTPFYSIKWFKILLWSLLPIVNVFCLCYAVENCFLKDSTNLSDYSTNSEDVSYE